MDIDPCCGQSLEKGTRLIAIIDITLSVASACFVWFFILLTLFYGPEIQEAVDKDRTDIPDVASFYDMGTPWIVFILLLYLGLCMVYILLGRMLLLGANERNYDKVHRWYGISLGLLVVRLLFYLVGAILATDAVTLPIFAVVGLVYQIYCLLVVRAYKRELASSGEYSRLRGPYNTDTIHKL